MLISSVYMILYFKTLSCMAIRELELVKEDLCRHLYSSGAAIRIIFHLLMWNSGNVNI